MELDLIYEKIFWNVFSFLLVTALCYALNRIRNFTKTLASTGIVANESLIKAHLGSFLAATTTNFVTFMLQLMADNFKKIDDETKCRLIIASNILSIFGAFSWLIANCLVMVIFVKYGKPLEDDLEKLI